MPCLFAVVIKFFRRLSSPSCALLSVRRGIDAPYRFNRVSWLINVLSKWVIGLRLILIPLAMWWSWRLRGLAFSGFSPVLSGNEWSDFGWLITVRYLVLFLTAGLILWVRIFYYYNRLVSFASISLGHETLSVRNDLFTETFELVRLIDVGDWLVWSVHRSVLLGLTSADVSYSILYLLWCLILLLSVEGFHYLRLVLDWCNLIHQNQPK